MTAVAVVGATGAVGREILTALNRRGFPVGSLRLMASVRSAGTTVETPWGGVTVEELDSADPSGVEVALFSAGGARSREHASRFVEAGAVVVDNSSAWRMDPEVPLVVAGINDHAVSGHSGIIANPNCSTMVMLMAVAPLHQIAPLTHLVATTYQSVSGSGQHGIETLVAQVDALGKDPDTLRTGEWSDPGEGIYPRPIGWNVLPLAGAFADGPYTDEELKLVDETRKILAAPDVRVEPTCVRVPVITGHGVAVSAWFERDISLDEAAAAILAFPGVQLWGDDKVPTPLDAAGIDDVLAGRLRPTIGRPGGISLWAVGDNLRKGAALNAVQIAELIVAQ